MGATAILKYHYSQARFAHLENVFIDATASRALALSTPRDILANNPCSPYGQVCGLRKHKRGTPLDGEFGWGGTSAKR